jgi:redox-sensitive bicupin YhaK (pirin superfamily)
MTSMLERVIDQRRRSLGGFEVGRVLPSAARRMVGPFIFFDHMGPVELAKGIPRDVDVRPHPHIGLATVTYLFTGEIMHRDSVGSEQAILPGEVNWMTAGSGITHSERFEKARADGGLMHGIQSWVALPDGQEEIAPSFSHHASKDLPVGNDKGMKVRVIAGEAYGLRAHVKTFSPIFYAHLEMPAGARMSLPDNYSQRAAYVVSGEVEVDGANHHTGQMLVFEAKQPVDVKALSAACVMVLGGEPVGRRYIEWNFVSSSKERLAQAKEDWRAGRMKLPDFDHDEFIPLPKESEPNSMS